MRRSASTPQFLRDAMGKRKQKKDYRRQKHRFFGNQHCAVRESVQEEFERAAGDSGSDNESVSRSASSSKLLDLWFDSAQDCASRQESAVESDTDDDGESESSCGSYYGSC